MKLKNIKTILFSSIVIFILCSLFHFGYTFLPHFITSIFFPVNESIFEHLKMLATAEVVFSLYVIFRKDKENGFLKMLLRIILSIFILLLLYIPVYSIFGEVMIYTFIVLFISIFLTEYILAFLKKNHPILNVMSIFLIIGIYLLFLYFTYYPLHEKLFYDEKEHIYGVFNRK